MAPQIAKASHNDRVALAQAETLQLEPGHWLRNPGLRKLYLYAAILCAASASNGYDGCVPSSLLDNIRTIPYWTDYFDDPRGGELRLLTAMYSIGAIASLPVVPFLADRFGRNLPIKVGCVIMIIAAAVQASAQSMAAFEGARFFMGFGEPSVTGIPGVTRVLHSNQQLDSHPTDSGLQNSLAQLSAPLLLTEICHPQHRGQVTAVYGCLWNAGANCNIWMTFSTKHINSDWSWRIPTLFQGWPSIVQLVFIWWVPESPRWLISQDRADEALAMLAKYHANGDVRNPTVQFEYAEIKETLRIEFQAKKTTSCMDFLRTRGNRYRLLLITSLGLFSQWSGNGLISYHAHDVYNSIGITGDDAQVGLNGGMVVMSLFISVGCAFLVDKVGRRPLFLTATASMLVCLVAWTICSAGFQIDGSDGAGKAVLAFMWLFNASYAIAWYGLLVAYTVEILPFKIRAEGLMIMNFWIQVALTINQQCNPIAFDAWEPYYYKLYIVHTVWVGFELAIVYLLYVETRGPTLEEIAKIFDGEDAEVANVDLKAAGISGTRASVSGSSQAEAEEQVALVNAARGEIQ